MAKKSEIKTRMDKMVRSRVKYDVTPEDQMVEAEEARERFNDLVDLVRVMDRLEKCRNADEVIRAFKTDAAKFLVMEMVSGKDRFKAIKELLDRGMGRPVDRSISVTQDLGSYSEEQLDLMIREKMNVTGYTGGERGVASFFVDEGEAASGEQEVCSEPGVSGEVLSESKKA